jgi:MFS transporter, putative metabolite:H+ symporter
MTFHPNRCAHDDPATSASDRSSAGHAARLITSLDQSAFTSRHGWIFGALMFGHFFGGFDLVLMGVALPGIIATFHITPPEAGFLASSAFFGMFIGAIGISMLADRIGRKRALILAILGYSLFSAAAAFVQDYTSLVVVRIYGACEVFAKRVGEITDNRFQIQVFAAGEIVPG